MKIINNKVPMSACLITLFSIIILGLGSDSLVFAEDNVEKKDNILEKIQANSFGMEKSIAIDIDSSFLSGFSQQPSSSFDLEPEDLMDRMRDQLIDAELVSPRSAFAEAIESPAISSKLAERIKLGLENDTIKMRIRGESGTVRMLKGELLKKTEMVTNGQSADIQLRNFPRVEQDKMLGRNFLNAYKGLLQVNNPEAEFKFVKREEDELKRCHLRYAQVYKGIPVWPAELMVHLDPEGDVDLMTGSSIPTPQKLVIKPSVGIDQAIQNAINAITDSEQVETSEPQLIIYAPIERMPRLSWKMEVNIFLASRWVVIVDAHTGGILNTTSQVYDANISGSGIDLFGVNHPLNLWEKNGDFHMVNASKRMFKSGFDQLKPRDLQGAIVILDAINDGGGLISQLHDVTSNNPKSSWLPDAVSAAFGLSETYDYFLERHSRNSIDGKGGTINAIVRFGQGERNAFWSSPYMVFGDGKPFAGALDVVAHELTHGVTEHTANLEYKNESGALNEAFSDIFGEMTEARTKGTPDWSMGSDLGKPLRNMRDPSSLFIGNSTRRYPSTMSEFIKQEDPFLGRFTDRDHGGVHLNSSIINHAFYLLAEGLPGAIGLRDAERIFYRTLNTKLQRQSQFLDARINAIISAEELFPSDPSRAQKVAEAFDAVEIFDNESTPEPVPIPENSGFDSTLSIFSTTSLSSYALFRNEEALGDDSTGELLSFQIAPKRPSVSGDGSVALFINTQNDICFIETDGSKEECLGFAGTAHSVALSRDKYFVAIVLLDEQGEAENSIIILDLKNDTNQTIRLKAPLTDGSTIDITRADSLNFSIDGKSLVYDAFNVINFADGTSTGLWSIYRLDIEKGNITTLIPPIEDVNIGNPSIGKTRGQLLTFDALDLLTGLDTIIASNLFTGKVSGVATVQNPVAPFYPSPVYTGDDSAIIYTVKNNAGGYSLKKQPLQNDNVTAKGASSLWLGESALGVIYRRGDFEDTISFDLNVVRTGSGFGLVSSSPAGINCAKDCSETFPKGTAVTLNANPTNENSVFIGWRGACNGAGSCKVTVNENKSVTAIFSLKAPPTSNDIFGNARLFAQQQYRDFLHREGDAGGIEYWRKEIESGRLSRAEVVNNFLSSNEFSGQIAPIVRLYFAYFRRIPDFQGLNYWLDKFQNGMSLRSISESFERSIEFDITYGHLSNASFVILVYQNVLQRAPDNGGFNYWTAELASGKSRGEIMAGFSESAEYRSKMATSVSVTMVYAGMLQRSPDLSGFNYWVDRFGNGGPQALVETINGFLGSEEYRNRF